MPTETDHFSLSTPHSLTLPIFDIQQGLVNFAHDMALFVEVIHALIEDIQQEKIGFQQAFLQHDWPMLGALAHKMRGVAVYVGVIKLQYACFTLEKYCQDNPSRQPISALYYHQLINVCDETITALAEWITANGG